MRKIYIIKISKTILIFMQMNVAGNTDPKDYTCVLYGLVWVYPKTTAIYCSVS